MTEVKMSDGVAMVDVDRLDGSRHFGVGCRGSTGLRSSWSKRSVFRGNARRPFHRWRCGFESGRQQ